MKEIIYANLVCLLILSCLSCNNNSSLERVDEIMPIDGIIFPSETFIKEKSPKHEINSLNDSNYSWVSVGVSYYKGQLYTHRPRVRAHTYFEINDGLLQGVDHCEFGGGLNFISFKSGKVEQTIVKGGISYIFEYKGKIYAFMGGGHLSPDAKGRLYEITRDHGKFNAIAVLDLDCRPQAMTIYKGKILVAGQNSFITIENLKVTTILKDAFWYGLYPNSIAVESERKVYIGMRSGYVRLDMTNGEMDFYRFRPDKADEFNF